VTRYRPLTTDKQQTARPSIPIESHALRHVHPGVTPFQTMHARPYSIFTQSEKTQRLSALTQILPYRELLRNCRPNPALDRSENSYASSSPTTALPRHKTLKDTWGCEPIYHMHTSANWWRNKQDNATIPQPRFHILRSHRVHRNFPAIVQALKRRKIATRGPLENAVSFSRRALLLFSRTIPHQK